DAEVREVEAEPDGDLADEVGVAAREHTATGCSERRHGSILPLWRGARHPKSLPRSSDRASGRATRMKEPAARGVGAAGSPKLLTAVLVRPGARRGSHRPVGGTLEAVYAPDNGPDGPSSRCTGTTLDRKKRGSYHLHRPVTLRIEPPVVPAGPEAAR